MSGSPARPGRPEEDAIEDDGGLDLAALFDYASFVVRSLQRHAVAATAVVLLGIAGTLIILGVLPRTYRVDTTILVQGDYLLTPLATGGVDKVTTTKGVAETILRHDNLISLIRQANLVERWKLTRGRLHRLKDNWFGLFRKPLNDDDLVDSLVFTLEKDLIVLNDDRTVTIAVSWRDPNDAYQITAAAEQNFLESRLLAETSAITDTITILESHVAAAREQVEAAVADAQVSRSRQARQSEPRMPASPVAEARRSSAPSGEALRIQGLLEAKQRAIEDLEQLRRRRLAELQAQYTEQRTVYAESHPLLVNLRESIQALGQDSTQLTQLRREAQALETEYVANGGRVDDPGPDPNLGPSRPTSPALILRELPSRDPREELDRLQLTNATAKYNALLDRLNGARLTLDTSRGSFKYRYVVIRPPLPPKVAIFPNTGLFLFAGVLTALLAGILAAVGLDVRKGLVVQGWQVRRLVGLPLLADLTATPTGGELPRPGPTSRAVGR
jgi:hypothetical protein